MMFLRAAIDTMGDDLMVIGGSAVTTTDRAGVEPSMTMRRSWWMILVYDISLFRPSACGHVRKERPT